MMFQQRNWYVPTELYLSLVSARARKHHCYTLTHVLLNILLTCCNSTLAKLHPKLSSSRVDTPLRKRVRLRVLLLLLLLLVRSCR